ncbi:hypothetical protein CAPTEDRAFT_191212 [Capitella teleta]|uniref:Uncharacterized protein n=1 Tax=Capitella teleta TaxID=283909 RepID=R7TF23_CAPTE|nr:hypothetical protein CAPTEDRAFT_191212 [Capitella teleta]|eukprot:ELT92334.1 hypothetical protein CAPTEDRAFT_191212 [Capitella teleta]
MCEVFEGLLVAISRVTSLDHLRILNFDATCCSPPQQEVLAFLEFVSADPKVDHSCCRLAEIDAEGSCQYVGEDLPQADSESEAENVEVEGDTQMAQNVLKAITPEDVWNEGEKAVLNCLQAVDMQRSPT